MLDQKCSSIKRKKFYNQQTHFIDKIKFLQPNSEQPLIN